ncbi:alpha-galactosidase [Kineococcus xinjiangensis]|uniref:Alpha-galactosidase n=1 Tax=Kineococcus xinjiangensis TaxID=512762 RepID=A0A2S6IE47_9ACTN|nr:alpha-glucosidase/alpha-galactosidase [Kineococcus xinjiangensis]PPK92481.1 alpha-galactosidase [Kineococcus xinjiangensis]
MSGPATAVAVLGAGSVVFTHQVVADLVRLPRLDRLDLRLHDVDPLRLATAVALTRRVAAEHGAAGRVRVSGHAERRAALAGAQFVVNTVQVGGLAATRTDLEVPARHGLRQTIGDTLGVGGIFRALRTAPFLAGVAADLAEVADDPLLLNYTNPMAMNVGYLAAVAPRLRVLGLCHSVHWTVAGLCSLVGVDVAEVTYSSAGVNHQAWLLRWERDGQDLFPELDRRIEADPEQLRRVRVDMYRRLGHFPTETSEHSAEYVGWYLHSDAEVERLRLRPGAHLRTSEDNQRRHEALSSAVACGGELGWVNPPGTEYAPLVVQAVVSGVPEEIVGNVVNDGLVPGLPAGAVVEVPCTVDAAGVHPHRVGRLPEQCAALNRAYLEVVAHTVRAAVTGDPWAVRHAAAVDPNTAASLDAEAVGALCDELVRRHGDLLPEPLRVPPRA